MLGLCWNLREDTLFYKLRGTERTETIWTKRKILSKIGQMYDPNGYLGLVLIIGKMIIQELWRSSSDWDEKVKGDVKFRWDEFNNDLKNVHLISINRWIGTDENERVQLHRFCDASEKGYGAVVHSRVRDNAKNRSEIMISEWHHSKPPQFHGSNCVQPNYWQS